MLWTYIHTTLATYALFLGVKLDWFIFKSFRIMTPNTTKRTALHKDGCPDSWSVIDGKAFNVEYQSHVSLWELIGATLRKLKVKN